MSDIPTGASRHIRFGLFELDLRSGDLRKSGTRLSLPEQPLQLLTALLERPGDLLTRDELQQRLWRGDVFVDFEHGLNAAVKRLREALGDSADSPTFVETVPRRGYRFIAAVEASEAQGLSGPVNASTQTSPQSSQHVESTLAREIRRCISDYLRRIAMT